jgi:hypothetical protein
MLTHFARCRAKLYIGPVYSADEQGSIGVYLLQHL